MRNPNPMRPSLLLAALGLALSAGPFSGPILAEDGVPKLDIERTCASSGRINIGISDQDGKDGCLRSERAAHDELKKRWGEFTPSAKAQCSQQAIAGGFPSYVETVTCLELATGVVPAQTDSDKTSTSGPGAPKGAATGNSKGAELTAEPSPKQRTNPIEILNDKP